MTNADNDEEQLSQPRGVFPGLQFFKSLEQIAKKTTDELAQIDHELLCKPTASQELEDGSIWSELHLQYNSVYNQCIGLQQRLSREPCVADSVDAFASTIHWLQTESDRIEKQLTQFGYEGDNDTSYDFDLPLTPQQQQAYDEQQKQQQQQQQQTQKKTAYQIRVDASNEHKTEATDDDRGGGGGNTGSMEVDHQVEQSSQEPAPSETQPSKTHASNPSVAQQQPQTENTTATCTDTNRISGSTSSHVTPTNVATKPRMIIPGTPRTPALDERFKQFIKNACVHQTVVNNKNTETDTNKENEKSNDACNASFTITPIASTSAAPKTSADKLPDTPGFDSAFDMNALRRKYGMPIPSATPAAAAARSNLDDSLGSIPSYRSPTTHVSSVKTEDLRALDADINNGEHKNALRPITAYQIKTTPQNIVEQKHLRRTEQQRTPITVSSFAADQHEHAPPKQQNGAMDTDNADVDLGEEDVDMAQTSRSNDASYGVTHISQQEFDSIPTWITNQLQTVQHVNETIDLLNTALKSWNGRVTKSQLRDLIGRNETPLILLLTRTNRLQTDWSQGNSVYCLKQT